METVRTTFELVGYKKDRVELTEQSEYYVAHHNGSTVLDQKVITRKENNRWTAELVISETPKLETQGESLDKLADWLECMAIAIRQRETVKE